MNQGRNIALYVCLVIIGAILVLEAVIGIKYYNQKKTAGLLVELPRVSQRNLLEVKKENAPSQNETNDWKVYRNKDYGFEIQYPSDWEQANKHDLNNNDILAKFYFIDPLASSDITAYHFLSVFKIENPNIFSLSELLNNQREECIKNAHGYNDAEYICNQEFPSNWQNLIVAGKNALHSGPFDPYEGLTTDSVYLSVSPKMALGIVGTCDTYKNNHDSCKDFSTFNLILGTLHLFK